MNARILSGLSAMLVLLALNLAAEPVAVSVNTAAPGLEISPGMAGLSYETSLLLGGTNGHYFRPDNQPLIAVFKTLGVKSLRIGGNSVDAPKLPLPSEADVTRFFEFAQAAGVKVIYSLRLEESTNRDTLVTAADNAASAARMARLIHARYASVLDAFAIGNEPSYFKDYAVYAPKWQAIHDAVVAEYPGARFIGPDQNPSPTLDRQMVQSFGNATDRLVEISQHSYPFGCAYKNPKDKDDLAKLVPFDAAASREKMLLPAAYAVYEKIRKGMADAVAGSSLSYRLSECNSYWFSGLQGASDSYASALWGVDYLHWWAAQGAAGLNFHTGDRTGGDPSLPCRYAALVTAGRGYTVRPLGYGLKFFALGGHGKELPVTVQAATNQNLVAYATLDDQTVCVTLINKTHGPGANKQAVQIELGQALAEANVQVIFLRARHDDIGGGSDDVSLGGAAINADGSWRGKWTRLRTTAGGHQITVTMPPASAAVVKAVIH